MLTLMALVVLVVLAGLFAWADGRYGYVGLQRPRRPPAVAAARSRTRRSN